MKKNNINISPLLDPESYPLLLPHIVCLEQDIYHGSRYITRLPVNQCDFLRSCDGGNSLAELVRNTQVKADFIAQAAGLLLWWPEAVQNLSEFSETTDRLILCSHPEDAWLGMGGSILLEAKVKRTAVVTCFSPFSGTKYSELYKNKDEFNLTCRDETAFAARLAGVIHSMWGIPENQSRIPAGYIQELAPGLILDDLRESIINTIETYNPAEVYVPGAISNSTDSRYLLEIILSLVAEGYLQCELFIYEDSPSIAGQRQVDEFIALFEGSYLAPGEFYVDTTMACIKKASLLDIFKCRFSSFQKQIWLQSDLRNAVLSNIPGAISSERFWKIQVKV